MAAQRDSQSGRACCVAEPEQSSAFATQDSPSNSQETEQEYDFVQEPDQDCFCPVSLELLVEPYLTSCCGHHISQQAANRLTREKKPCPMCKEEGFTAHVDKFFKRKFINTLKVRCPHKGNGCEWTGELRDLNYHSSSCPKRPWKCQYCHFESTFDIGTNHTPNCAQYPQPCPNQCEIVTIPRCDAENHLLVCPLQLVECEFASVGCEVKVPRRDLARHMTENTQHHLMSATLLNLRLTRELHQKMEEKDKQIAELKQQLNEHEAKMTEQNKEASKALAKDLDAKLTHQTNAIDTKLKQQMSELDSKLSQQTKELDAKFKQQSDTKFAQQTKVLDKKTKELDTKFTQITQDHHTEVIKRMSTIESVLLLEITSHEFTLTEFKKHQAKGSGGSWYSDSFYSSTEGYRFELNIDTNGHRDARGTHLSAYLFLYPGDYDKELQWPLEIKVYLEMLNKRGDHSHHVCLGAIKYEEATKNRAYKMIGSTDKFFPLADLMYDAQRDTEYLRNDSIKFRLRLKKI